MLCGHSSENWGLISTYMIVCTDIREIQSSTDKERQRSLPELIQQLEFNLLEVWFVSLHKLHLIATLPCAHFSTGDPHLQGLVILPRILLYTTSVVIANVLNYVHLVYNVKRYFETQLLGFHMLYRRVVCCAAQLDVWSIINSVE